MTEAKKVPWHLWVVGVIALLWNAYGGYDYYMTMTQGEAYMTASGLSPEMIAYYGGMPSWMAAVWAVGVWGGVAAAVLLLLRMNWAVYAFFVSLAAFLVSVVYTYGLSDGASVVGQQGMIMSAVIGVAALFFLWYALRMQKRHVLH
ncbi:hypothetical protein [Brevundimonas sp.]|uniref:hypothetical protein n=1 Tax=Brevundimonas sp. TaxID=1871086 RepID=UPI003A917C8B|tara:strand:- start:3 stop:440 length:438 start_codon:yes stop_codon:yes gene_type:complete